MRPRIVAAVAGLSVCIVAAARAQAPVNADGSSESVNVDVSDCLDLETREQQIACYLARVDEAVEARETAASDDSRDSASSAPSGAAQTESRRSVPPLAPREAPQPLAQRAAQVPAAAENVEEEQAEEIVATITSLRELQPDIYVIDLDNGQVWRQSSPKRYFLREGAEVHLVPSRWGPSYRLTDPDVGNFIQVERVR